MNRNRTTWRVQFLGNSEGWEGELRAYWEVQLDPMSDDYTPREISALDLLGKWASAVKEKVQGDLVPIHWFVESPGHGKFERLPFQFNHLVAIDPEPGDFLTFFSWPVKASTGEPLNWVTLPVVDKLWNGERADKGGFIQEATGWKPAILQPFVHLPTLVDTRR
jgi:hypothetical protein